MKKSDLHTSINTASHCLHWCFSQKFFICWLNRPTLRQAGSSRRLPDIMLPDMMTFIASALQMGHALKDTLHNYWSRLIHLQNPFHGETTTRDRFLHTLCFLNFADNSQRPDKGKEYDWLQKPKTIFANQTRLKLNTITPRSICNCNIQGQGYLQAVHFKEKKMFQHQNLQTLWWIMVYIWHESVLG